MNCSPFELPVMTTFIVHGAYGFVDNIDGKNAIVILRCGHGKKRSLHGTLMYLIYSLHPV